MLFFIISHLCFQVVDHGWLDRVGLRAVEVRNRRHDPVIQPPMLPG